MLKKTLALFLTLLLCVSGSTMAFAASDNAKVIMGEVNIVNPTFVVSVPLNLDFSIDPLKIKGQSQIFSGETSYNIVNKATVPVKVDFALKITATTGVTFAADDQSLVKTLPGANAIAKDLYVAIQGAEFIDTTKVYDSSKGTITAPTGGNLAATTSSGNVVPVYATPATTNLLDFEETGAQEASGIFSFLVNAGEVDPAAPTTASKQKPTATSMTSFRLFGDLNTYADWDAADFEFEGSYNFIGVAQEDYNAAMADTGDYAGFMHDTTNAPALVATVAEYAELAQPAVPDYTFAAGALSATPISTGLAKADVWSESNPLVIKFDSASKPTSINALATSTSFLSSSPWTSGTDYSYNASTGILTVTRTTAATSVVFRVNSGSGTVVTLNFTA